MIFKKEIRHPVFLAGGDWTTNAEEVVEDTKWIKRCDYIDILCYLRTYVHIYQELFLDYNVK